MWLHAISFVNNETEKNEKIVLISTPTKEDSCHLDKIINHTSEGAIERMKN